MRYFISIWMVLTGYWVQAQDLALAIPGGEILQPVSGCSLSSTENVTIRIFNFGPTLPIGTLFNVSYTVNSGLPVSEPVVLSSNLLSHSSFTYTFTTQADFSSPGNHIVDATVSLPGDVNPTNNTFTGHVVFNSVTTAGGSVTADQTICGITNSGTLSLSGQTGDIVRWETSQDGGITWRYVSQTTATQNFLNLDITTSYRAVVKNGVCGEAISSDATVTIICGLPLTWMSFNARRAGNNVELEWQTADEVNTSHFVVERDAGNNLFYSVGNVPARSSSGQYKFIDRNVPHTALKYRIRQVDLDSRYSYSSVRRVENISAPPSVVLRNNPVSNGNLSFDVKGYPNGNAVITILNMNGKKIRSSDLRVGSANQTINLPVHGMATGIYILTIESGNLFMQKKFVITR
jgi:hypothetical protein